MDKNAVYKKFFDLLLDSMKWADRDDKYYKYVGGVIDMTNTILDEFDDKEEEKK